jgi:hypothetical protein
MSGKSKIKLLIIFDRLEELRKKDNKFKWYKSSQKITEFNSLILYKKISLKLNIQTPKLFCSGLVYKQKKYTYKPYITITLSNNDFIDTLNIIDNYSRNYIYDMIDNQDNYCCFITKKNYVNYILHNFGYREKIDINIVGNIVDEIGNIINISELYNKKFFITGMLNFNIHIQRNFILLKMKFIQPRICKII